MVRKFMGRVDGRFGVRSFHTQLICIKDEFRKDHASLVCYLLKNTGSELVEKLFVQLAAASLVFSPLWVHYLYNLHVHCSCSNAQLREKGGSHWGLALVYDAGQ